ncbi:hypothetical protein [Enterococcus plantarum]|uniref:hypothetical protein n=1 Tax=Enterococcus plantarum TaxID=1077675 RepID=UPI001F5E6D66|nr:hypothetical protein [Enterococcus plantarum]
MIVERTQEGKALEKLDPNFLEDRLKKFINNQLDLAMHLLRTDTTKNVSRKQL